jgi:hypothetical protein
MSSRHWLCIALLTTAASTAWADLASYSPALPASSPVPSASIDDIPPAATNVLTYDGTLKPSHANFMMSYLEINENDQRVWFNPQALETTAVICYNRRYRSDVSSPWQWQYSASPVVQVITDNPGTQRPPSIATASVLYDPVNQFFSGSAYYPFIMYVIWQPSACNGVAGVGGFIHVSFSSDGTSWTSPREATRFGRSSFPCWPGHSNVVPAEEAGVAYDGSTIYFAWQEGTNSILAQRVNMDAPQVHIGYATRNNPWIITPYPADAMSGQNVINNSYTYGDPARQSRYTAYSYFFNMQMAYDAVHGDVYLSRAYPYGYDRGSNGPSDYPLETVTPHYSIVYDRKMTNPETGLATKVEGCVGSPATYPNRIQVYKKHIGSLSNFSSLATGYWTLVLDYGLDVGYLAAQSLSLPHGPAFNPPANQYLQTDVGRDLTSAVFLTDRWGQLKFYGSTAYMLAGEGFASSLSRGPCRVTGNERAFAYPLPQ